MNKILYALVSLLAFASCADTYTITGSSNDPSLDGRMLYLKVLQNNDFKNVDSCDVVHGQFNFQGTIDTTRMANLFMDDESLTPLVLEAGDITVKLNVTQRVIGGTPLNDKLYQFFKAYYQLESRKAELVHQHDQALMNGIAEEAIVPRLNAEAEKIANDEDKLVTNFVTSNFDNVLGPGVFFMVTIDQQYPMLSPWIEDIMSRATDNFKNDAYVKDFYQKAQENEQIMNGMRQAPTTQAPQPAQPEAAPAPTPNELAKPAQE